MLMDAGIDTGDILLTATTEIRPGDTAGKLSGRLSLLGADLLIRTLDGLWDGSLQPTPQALATTSAYTKKIKKSHGEIDWSQDAAKIERRVRAMTPWPSAFTFRRGRRLIIVGAAVSDEKSKGADPGTVVSLDPLTVACGLGTLEILLLKPEGKKAMTPQAYLAGRPTDIGEVLG
jgi:methionyl-tRNA formyltransferase